MDRSRVVALAAKHLPRLRTELGISHWTIHIRYDEPFGEHGADGSRTRACVHTDLSYDHATIDLNCAEIDDEAELIETLHHELLHVVLAPYDLLSDYAEKAVEKGSVEAERLVALYSYCCERAVIAVGNAITGSVEAARRGPRPGRRRKGR